MEPNIVPYLPINEFDPNAVLKNFSEEDENPPEKVVEDDSDGSYDSDTSEERFDFENVELALLAMNMEKYFHLFYKNTAYFDVFIKMNENDLREIGITDENDIKIIIKNLSFCGIKDNDVTVPKSNMDDYKILNNVHNQLLLLQQYLFYVELKLRKNTLTDFRVNEKEKASVFLKSFCNLSSTQCEEIKDKIYNSNSSCNLLNVILKKNNLPLPKKLLDSCMKNKGKSRIINFLTTAIFSGFVLFIGTWYRLKD